MQTELKMTNAVTWIIKETADDVALLACESIVSAAQQAIENTGTFRVVLAGGTTPKKIYALLARESCDWQHWHIYLGDERCLPVDDPERNSKMIHDTFLTHIKIPEENIHFIPAELGAKKAALPYVSVIDSAFPFDMVLLGMGEDGHTASLFPAHMQNRVHNPEELVHAVFNAPKPPSERVSLSVRSLSECKHLFIIVTGLTKQDSVIRWREGENLPIAQIGSIENTNILLDRAAWSGKDE
jgi:6-phosphogluconolactonase